MMPCVYDDVPGSWRRQSEGWPSIDDPDNAARMLVIKNKLVPYGSYVTVDGRLRLETTEYVERVQAAMEATPPNPVRAEQPGSAVQGENREQEAAALGNILRRFSAELSLHERASLTIAVQVLSGTTPPPAPAAEQGEKPVVHVGAIGHVDYAKTMLTAALTKVGQMQQPEARGVEGEQKLLALKPTAEMCIEGAKRLVRWEDNSKWPDSWSPAQRAAAINEAERVFRSMWLAAAPTPVRAEQPEGKGAGVAHRGSWWIVLMGAFQIGPLFATEGEANEHAANFNAMLAAAPAAPGAAVGVDILPMDDDVRDILGRPCFTLIGLANALRKAGFDIPPKAEAEQAACLHWMLNLYLKHGAGWRKEGNAALTAALAGKDGA